MPLKPLDTPSLSEQAYIAIKDSILSLELPPGETLGIGDLADKLGVSRTPVRDALLLLEKDGLVVMFPQKGAVVSEIRARDIEEIYELRILLESYAVRIATSLLTNTELDHIESILQEAEQTFNRGELVRTADISRTLHDVVIDKVGNSLLKKFLDDLEMHYTRVRRLIVRIPGRFEKSHRQHQEVLQALRGRDAEAAAAAMEYHLISVRDEALSRMTVLMTYLENPQELSSAPAFRS